MMMKWIVITLPVLILCLVLSTVAPTSVFAATNTKNESAISLGANQLSVSKGDVVKVKVSVHHVTDLYGVQFKVKFDPSKLTLKEAVPVGGYSDFGGKKISTDQGVILLPLLREQVTNQSEVALLDVAELSFVAQGSGNAVIELKEIKAVSTESFTNEAGLKDLKSISLIDKGPLRISIQSSTIPEVPSNPDTPTFPTAPSMPGTPNISVGDVNKSLQDIERLLNADQWKEAIYAVNNLLTMNLSSFSSEQKRKLEDSLHKLLEGLQTSITPGNYSGGVATMNDESLKYAVKSLTDLVALSKKHGLSTEVDKLIRFSVPALSEKVTSLQMTPEQISLLEQNGMTIELNWTEGKVKVYPKSLPKQAAVRLSLSTSKGTSTSSPSDNALQQLVSYDLSILTINGAENVPVTQMPEAIGLLLPFKAAEHQLHKLGVYAWDEQSGIWKYIRNAKQLNGMFELDVIKPGTYAVMEYSVDFTDIQNLYQEAKHAIEALTAKHLMFGTGQDKFSPNQDITRAEFTSLLVRALDLKSSTQTFNVFSDVKPGAWYEREVLAAWEAGIVKGSGGKFEPDAKLTREQMAVMMMNAVSAAGKMEEAKGHNKFGDDSQISSWAKDYIYAAVEKGLLKGNASNHYLPKAHASRVEAAIILLRWLDQP
ncbi:S-layer homology domain-containing protein [Paenibacillus sp. EC2-1]|uniref:S-layer homology domain-containing protein n=1 Tax=Paenibacillus sp. EC2-1 TaxID=3388665 RepID=UPI003BEECAAC